MEVNICSKNNSLFLWQPCSLLLMASATKNIFPYYVKQLQFVWSVSALVKRKIIQILTTFLYNANLPGFLTGNIYRGSTKSVCVPGLNCYSCPGALGACPLGSLQSSFSGVFLRIPFYVLGSILLFSILLGRLICGWLCPFGLLQELLYKIPTPKIKRNNFTRKLSLLKYFIAVIFLLILPIVYYLTTGVGVPAFCKFICPAGTFEAGIPLTTAKPMLKNALGWLFTWKFFLLLLTIFSSIFIYRPFCRFICPLGAIYGLFNKLSIFGVNVDMTRCIGCDKCMRHCQMDCHAVGDRECINCGECANVCPTKAISIGKKSPY